MTTATATNVAGASRRPMWVLLLLGACLSVLLTVLLVSAGKANAAFGIKSFNAMASAFDGGEETQAGVHPYEQYVRFRVNDTAPDAEGKSFTDGSFRTVVATLPPGLVGDPTAVPTCPRAMLELGCDPSTQIGTIGLLFPGINSMSTYPLYNLKPRRGDIADLGFAVLGVLTHITVKLDASRNYAVRTITIDASQALEVSGAKVTLWGVPADPSHTPSRGTICYGTEADPEEECFFEPQGAGVDPVPYLSNPTSCGPPLTFDLAVNKWGDPSRTYQRTSFTGENGMTGCDQVEFEPTIQARPTTGLADSPSGLEFDLHMPQNEDLEGLSTAHMRDISVTLPEGMTVNPPSAEGLGACSLAQIGMSAAGVPDESPVSCPDNSKLGTLEAVSPAVDHPMAGTVYLAEQNANPFGSLLALYLLIEDPETGIRIKLAGEVETDPNTGQVTTVFRNNPQLPVEDLRLKLRQGPRAALKTPASCGSFETRATIVPWSAPEAAVANRSSSFELSQGPSGGACPGPGGQAPNSPSFSAGTVDPTAAAYTPFVLKLARNDGTQQIKGIDTTLPKGLLAKLAGTPYCSDAALAAAAGRSGKAEQASAGCPAQSQVGSVDVGAGAGSTPLYVSGKVYLAGPYKGAPLSLGIVTPAVAGPFDLGTVVVRAALQVDPESARVHAVSDLLPTIIQGIPLDIRSVALRIDKPGFTLNPTSCNPTTVTGQATSVFGQAAALTSPFQVGECGRLGFKPRLAIKLKGGTKRSDYPALRATLNARGPDANIARTVVALPRSAFLAQNHIKTICTRVQFAAEQCPAGSVYGRATAWSPLLDQPLSGPVYLRSSSNKLPDLVAAMDGQIDVDLIGRIDSVRGGIRTSFDSVPDAPVSKFVLQMQGGKKGLLENSRNLCKSVNKAAVQMDAQNGKVNDFAAVVQNSCKKKHKKAKKAGKRRQG